MESMGSKMDRELKELRHAKEYLQNRLQDMTDKHAQLLAIQEAAYDNDITENTNNDVYVFCLWMLRRFGTVQEAVNRPSVDWQGEIHRGILRGLRNISQTP